MKDTKQAATNNYENCSRSVTLAELQAIISNLQSELKHSTDIQFKMGARSALSMLVAQLQALPSIEALVENTSLAAHTAHTNFINTSYPVNPSNTYDATKQPDAAITLHNKAVDSPENP